MREIKVHAMQFPHIQEIMDAAVKDIFERVAKLTVSNSSPREMKAGDPWSLAATTCGDYSLTMILCADSGLLYTMVRNMKRGRDVNSEDIPIYATEFFNILCGHVISAINRENHCNARFSIPLFVKGLYVAGIDQGPGYRREYYYSCGPAAVKVELVEEQY